MLRSRFNVPAVHLYGNQRSFLVDKLELFDGLVNRQAFDEVGDVPHFLLQKGPVLVRKTLRGSGGQ